jgi:hypothetical protein
MNSTIAATIIVVGVVALLIWWLSHRSKGQKTTSEWESEGDTSFVSKISEPTTDKQQPRVEKPKSQATDN